MRINTLHIDGFGVYHDRSIETGAPLTVFYGPNESGKSTILAFIRTVLYGFRSPTSSKCYPPLSVGQHGGRLVIADESGKLFTVERHIGSRGGQLVVRSNGKEISDGSTQLETLCGNQPRTVFEKVMSFNLGELPNLLDRQDEDITSEFYSAAIGANALQDAMKTLKKRQQSIYKTARAKGSLKDRLAHLEDLDKCLRDVEGQSADYADTTRRLDELKESLRSSKEKEKIAEAERDELKRYLDSWSLWCALVEFDSQLPTESRFDDFPDNPMIRLDTFETTIEEHRDKVEKLNAAISETEVLAERAITHETLIGDSARCDALVKGEEKHQSACADVQGRQTSVNSKQDEVTKTLRNLGPDWTKEQVEVLDISVTVMDEVDGWKTRFDEAQQQSKTRGTVLDNVEDSYRKQELNVTRLENEIDPSMGDALEANVSLIETTLARHTAYIRALENPSTSHRSPSAHPMSRWFEITIGALSLSAIALAGWIELPWLGLMGVGGLVIALLIWKLRGEPHNARTSQDAEENAEAENSHREYADALHQLGLGEPESVEVSDLTKLQERLSAEIRSRKTLADERNVLNTRADQAALQRKAKVAHQDQIDELKAQWRAWLTSHDFPETLQVQNGELFVEKVKNARTVIELLKVEEKRLYGITQDIKEYRQQVEALAERHDIPLDASITDATIWTEQIKDLLEKANKEQENRENTRKSLSALKVGHKTACAALNRESDKLNELLKASKARDVEEFRRLAKESLRIQDVKSSREEARGQFRAMWRNEYTDEELAKMFHDCTKDDLEGRLNRVDDWLSELRTSQEEDLKEQATLEATRESMDGDEQASQYRAEREVMRTEANALAEEWSTLIVAQWLLEKARRKYEDERQPAVIQSASGWFTQMTDGRYTKIVPQAEGNSEFAVLDRRERTKTPAQLSRGTQDQLYLALRFGLIHNHGERLPVIVDEALVNCDPDRAKVAASAFAELARTNQVLVMTCHPWMRDLFVQASPDAKVVDLGS
jgi:uncharacterized protein YhaN